MQTRRQEDWGQDATIADGPMLPVQGAFVVQLGRDCSRDESRFVGRVEHISSGRQARFSDEVEMVAAIRKMIQDTNV